VVAKKQRGAARKQFPKRSAARAFGFFLSAPEMRTPSSGCYGYGWQSFLFEKKKANATGMFGTIEHGAYSISACHHPSYEDLLL